MVVPGVAVEEAELVADRRGVDDLIYLRQPEGVTGEVFVEVGVVDAHPLLIGVLLMDKDRVGERLRMEDFSNEASRELFGEFLLDGISSVVGETAEVLSFRGSFRVDVE
jgi:hypothetical protein